MDEPLTPAPSPVSSFDSIIVPPEPPPTPPQVPEEKKPVPAAVPSGGNGTVFKKKFRAGPMIATLLLLLITLPLSVIFIANRNQLSDVRSRAAGGTCTSKQFPLECTHVPCGSMSESNCKSNSTCCSWTAAISTPTVRYTCGDTAGQACWLTTCTNGPGSGTCSSGSCCKTSPATTIPPTNYTCTNTAGQFCSAHCPNDNYSGVGTCASGTSCCGATITVITTPATCPEGLGTCSAVGAQCYAGIAKGAFCCVKNPSGSTTWEPKGPNDCPKPGETVDCPLTWGKVNGICCPTSPDACTTLGEIVCIKDPYASRCTVWNNSCPDGQKNYYKAFDWCNEPGCYESYLMPKYGCEPTTPSGGQCADIQILKGGTVVTDFSTIRAGDVISIEVKGVSATKGRIRINGATWVESTLTKDIVGGESAKWFVVPNVTIPSGVTSITIESEVYVDSVWK